MRAIKTILLALTMILPAALSAQEKAGVEIDYNNPRKYIVSGVSVEGNTYFSSSQIIQLTGLMKGMEITVPGDDISSIIDRLWAQKYFEDISIKIDHLSENADSAWFVVGIKERARVSTWTYTGVKSGERKDLQERLNLKRGGEYSEYVGKTSSDIIRRFYAEKGYLNCTVTPEVRKDTVIKNAIKVNFSVNRGTRVRIKEINFIGDKTISDFKLEKAMKKTNSAKIYNFFQTKKFKEKEYANDKSALISAFNEAGFRDARIIKDSIYTLPDKPNRLAIDFYVDEGKKYYFRNITWTGNSVYPTDALNEILSVKKGDPYDIVTMQKRLQGGGKQNDYDVSKLYRDNGYLFFNVTPVEMAITQDSIDVEMRISEGKPATLNNIIINGNDLTSEKVVRRQVFTRPGYLFSQTDFERSIREIASLGQFDPEAIADASKGYSILPNQADNTVDIVYNVTEKPSSQLELSGGWGGRTFVVTTGVSFNNFSSRRLFDKTAWRPVPLGDAQNLTFHFQTNGRYYTSLSASFTEPWLFGKKPTSLSISAYYSRMTNSILQYNILNNDKSFEVFGFQAGIGNRLKWPDNYFVLYNGLSWQTYKLRDWSSSSFIINNGMSHNISYIASLSRNSTDQQIYPRQGSNFSLSLQATPPYSLLRKKDWGNLDANGKPTKVHSYKDIDYDTWTGEHRYKWIEYYKFKFNAETYTKLFGNFVLMTRAQFGYLGYYNRRWGYSPFEGFYVGGDGMSGYDSYGTEVIALRGYENGSLTPYANTKYNQLGYASAGNVYDKYTVELRFPVVMQPQSTIFVLGFVEGGNCWSDIRDFNPFEIKRSAGVGVRVFLPVVGLLGIDWGYGFDDHTSNGKSHFHFMIGQQF